MRQVFTKAYNVKSVMGKMNAIAKYCKDEKKTSKISTAKKEALLFKKIKNRVLLNEDNYEHLKEADLDNIR